MERLFVAAAALANAKGEVLIQQRPSGRPLAGLWEFPGGKVERGESAVSALARELGEELGITVERDALVPLTFACEPMARGELVLLLFGCSAWQGEPVPLDRQRLAWRAVSALDPALMPPADRAFPAAIAAWLADAGPIR